MSFPNIMKVPVLEEMLPLPMMNSCSIMGIFKEVLLACRRATERLRRQTVLLTHVGIQKVLVISELENQRIREFRVPLGAY